MVGRRYRVVGVLLAALTGIPGAAAAQTSPPSPSEPAPSQSRTPHISGTFELLESIATDGRSDPAFEYLDGESGLRIHLRVRCPARSLGRSGLEGPAPFQPDGSENDPRFRSTRVSWEQLERMRENPCVLGAEPARLPGRMRPLEITTRETGASAAHLRPDSSVTGEGRTIALLDSPVDILHPAFFRPDGGRFDWIDVDGDGSLTPGRDAVDLDGDGTADADETLRVVGVSAGFPGDDDGFQPRQEWLYADVDDDGARSAGPSAGFTELDPGYGEPTFVADDVDRDGTLEPREFLYRLDTSKIRRMVRGDEAFERGEDLVRAAAELESPSSHGTAVAGILVGGPLGFHARVGVAPHADLLVYGSRRSFEPGARNEQGRQLRAIRDAAERGADVFVSEWTNPFLRPLDGSTNVERAMERARSDGTHQVVPVGNLNRSEKHRQAPLTPGDATNLRFRVPDRVAADGSEFPVRTVFGTLQSAVSSELEIRLEPPAGPPEPLEPVGDPIEFAGFDVQSAATRTERGTFVFTFYIRGEEIDGRPGNLPEGEWTFRVRGAESPARLYGRVTDTHSGWNPGVRWIEPTEGRATLSFPATGDAAIGVAAYSGRTSIDRSPDRETGSLRPFSGRGPRFDGGRGVDIAAPDNAFVPAAAESFSEPRGTRRPFRQFGGTSSAAPHVGGALALLRERNPRASVEALESRLLDRAADDGLEPRPESVPGPAWGHGRLRIHRSLFGAPAPAGNRPPVAALDVRIDGESVRYDASESSDPDGDALEFRLDCDHDGLWESPWRDRPEFSRPRRNCADGSPIVGRIEIRDEHGSRSGALAVARPTLRDASPSDIGSDVSASGGGTRGCRTLPGRPPPPLSTGLSVLASLLLCRRWDSRSNRRPTPEQ